MSNKKNNTEEVVNEEVVNNQENVNEASQTEANNAEAENEKNPIDKLTEDLAVCQDKYIRLVAEFDNFRKRTLKEKMDLIEYSGEDVIKLMLSVLDDMDRAVKANEKSEDINAIREGMVLIRQKMLDSLKQKNVTELSAMGEKLDTEFHDAIAKFPVEDETKKGTIIDVIEKGYKLKEKVVRYAKVVVGE